MTFLARITLHHKDLPYFDDLTNTQYGIFPQTRQSARHRKHPLHRVTMALVKNQMGRRKRPQSSFNNLFRRYERSAHLRLIHENTAQGYTYKGRIYRSSEA